jgi:hypothetical protein
MNGQYAPETRVRRRSRAAPGDTMWPPPPSQASIVLCPPSRWLRLWLAPSPGGHLSGRLRGDEGRVGGVPSVLRQGPVVVAGDPEGTRRFGGRVAVSAPVVRLGVVVTGPRDYVLFGKRIALRLFDGDAAAQYSTGCCPCSAGTGLGPPGPPGTVRPDRQYRTLPHNMPPSKKSFASRYLAECLDSQYRHENT